MRRAGRIEPGRGGGVFTGQSVLFLPARIALMRAMLSFLVRPATDGTVIGGSFGVVSAAIAFVLDAFVAGAIGVTVVGVEVAANAVWVAVTVDISGPPPGGIRSSAVVAPASLLAAQPARDPARASVKSTETDLL